jgi:predicted DNA-binding ArsR family transcriptional regulator
MVKQDEYRKYARDAVRLASHASSTAKKTLLLALAERWLDLADAEEKRAKADQGARLIDRHDGRPVSGEHQKGE